MDNYIKIVELNNEIEANLMDDILNDRDIPHLINSYRDIAYDGIFQLGSWGHIEADPENEEEIKEIYKKAVDKIKNGEN
ncbi:MAG: hypothetical protein ACOCQH_03045 [Halanaerobiales bacterium]